MATDYDCWHPDHEHVTVDQVVAVLLANAALARRVVAAAIPKIVGYGQPAPQSKALANALMTQPSLVSAETRQRLAPLIGKYLPA
jgi:5'-methylthioadenosine phosphorylase